MLDERYDKNVEVHNRRTYQKNVLESRNNQPKRLDVVNSRNNQPKRNLVATINRNESVMNELRKDATISWR